MLVRFQFRGRCSARVGVLLLCLQRPPPPPLQLPLLTVVLVAVVSPANRGFSLWYQSLLRAGRALMVCRRNIADGREAFSMRRRHVLVLVALRLSFGALSKRFYWDALYRSALKLQERSSIGPLSSDTSLSATDVIFRPLCLRRLHCCGDQ